MKRPFAPMLFVIGAILLLGMALLVYGLSSNAENSPKEDEKEHSAHHVQYQLPNLIPSIWMSQH